jgi:hypothetical protein
VTDVLVKLRYRGYNNFEWEKHWHPEIEEPEARLRRGRTWPPSISGALACIS